MSNSIKLGNVVVCEYIAEGIRNKHTLINTYSGDILVGEFPGHIAIAFYIEFFAPRPYKGPVEIKIMLGKKEIMRGNAEVDLPSTNPSVIAIPMGLLLVEGNTTLRLILTLENEKPIKAVEKKISLAAAL